MPIYGIDYKDKPEDARAPGSPARRPLYAGSAPIDGQVGIDWGVYGVPETYVVDRAGRIRYKHVGPLTRDRRRPARSCRCIDPARRRMRRGSLWPHRCCWRPGAAPAYAVQPDEMLADPALEARARDDRPGAALPGLPEPVDRRFRRRSRPRPARAGARAPRRRRQRRAGGRLCPLPATAISCCCAAVQARHRAAVVRAGCCPAGRRRGGRAGSICAARAAAAPPPLSAEKSAAARGACSTRGAERMSIGLAIALLGADHAGAGAAARAAAAARRRRPRSRDAYNLAVYRDQLAEIERDVARGMLSAEQAEAARAEIGRRILALTPAAAAPAPRRRAARGRGRRGAAAAGRRLAALLAARLAGAARPALCRRAQRGAGHRSRTTSAYRHGRGGRQTARASARTSRRSDRLAAARPLADRPRPLSTTPPTPTATPPICRASGRHRRRLGRGAGDGRRRHGHPAAKKAFEAALKDPESAPRSRYYLALADIAAGRRKGRAAGLGRSRSRFARPMPNGCRCCASASPRPRRRGDRPGDAQDLGRQASARRRRRRPGPTASHAAAVGRYRRAVPSRAEVAATARATADASPGAAPGDDPRHGRQPRREARTEPRRCRRLGSARPLLHGARRSRQGRRRLCPGGAS